MNPSRQTALRWFWGGVVAFAVVLLLHYPLATDGVPGGILDHQSAPDAATVDAIQASWAQDGLLMIATIAMIGDIVFILIYGAGSVLAGLHFRSLPRYWPSLLGWIAILTGAIFLIADLGETTAQLVQMIRFQGNDQLAGFASGMGALKSANFIAAFLAVVIAQFLTRQSTSDA